VVPPDLADILKAYTKEIIRRNPADLLEFSARYARAGPHSHNKFTSVHTPAVPRYFRNLADVASSAQEASAPSQEQVVQSCMPWSLPSPLLGPHSHVHTVPQLQVFRQRVGDAATLTPEQVHAVASQLGIAKSVVAKVLVVGRFASSVSGGWAKAL
jgi:hypothetical protein